MYQIIQITLRALINIAWQQVIKFGRIKTTLLHEWKVEKRLIPIWLDKCKFSPTFKKRFLKHILTCISFFFFLQQMGVHLFARFWCLLRQLRDHGRVDRRRPGADSVSRNVLVRNPDLLVQIESRNSSNSGQSDKRKKLRMRESYKRFVKTWIRTVSWLRILSSKRFNLCLTKRIRIRFVSWIMNP